LPQSIAAEHGGGIVEKISLDGIDSLCGVESLRVVSNYDSSVKSVDDNNNEYFSDEKNNLTSGIDLACINGWVRDCTVKHARNAAVKTMDPARYCTVRDCKSLEPVAPILGGRRYPFSFNGGSHSLFYKCYTEDARHAYAAGSRVVGPNGFVNCTAWRSTTISEPHHRWCTGLLYDNITLKEGGTLGALNRGNSGSGHGWAGANIVFWNCNAEAVVVFDPPTPEQNFAIGYTGEIRDEYPTERLEYANDRSGYAGTPMAGIYKGFALMGTGYIENPGGPVAPESLFMQQLIDRIGKERAALAMNVAEQDISIKESEMNSKSNKDLGAYSLPYIKETNGVKQLIVDDESFVILGGELMNSSASSIEYMEPIWERVRSLNVNTLLLPINWQQFEPVESEFHIKFPAKPYDLVENVVLNEVTVHKLKLFSHDGGSKAENLTPF
jgi:hypothetical protein